MQKFLTKNFNLLFIIILILAVSLRLYGINWDQGHYLHPDERAIIMFTTPISFPKALEEFLNPQSPLNPHFFAYGNFPLYLLKTVSLLMNNINILFSTYEQMYLVGRAISAFADIGTLIVLFLIGKRISGRTIGLFASLFYAVSVFPIQASHFFAVDTLLTFFITLTLYRLLIFYEKPSNRNAIIIGISFGLSLVTKISALILIAPILAALVVNLLHTKKFVSSASVIAVATIITFIVLQPYALIDSKEFIAQNLLQSKMTHDAYIFPYTLQYVDKLPYIYELKNIFLWGLGPILAIPAFIGVLYNLLDLSKKKFILFIFFLIYFIIVGKFAVGWMRYMLPLYPLFCLFAAILVLRILKFFPASSRFILNTLYLILIIIWPLSFMHIYTKPHPRIATTNWIQSNIPAGSTLAVEHWDDRLPLSGGERYNFVEMTLYDQPDDDKKWEILNQKLAQTDYIILSSNRLYTPLPKLADCTKYRSCYPKTAKYYQNLFSGSLGFEKVAEFTSFPTIPLFNIPIDDQNTDEAFTVYDHPKVIIFKRI